MYMYVDEKVVGVASISSSTRVFEVCEVLDDDHFSNLEVPYIS